MLAGTRDRLQGLLESCRGNAAGALASLAVAGFLVTGAQSEMAYCKQDVVVVCYETWQHPHNDFQLQTTLQIAGSCAELCLPLHSLRSFNH